MSQYTDLLLKIKEDKNLTIKLNPLININVILILYKNQFLNSSHFNLYQKNFFSA